LTRTADMPPKEAPKDYAEMYTNYFGYIRSLCVKYGIDYEDVNDVAQDLICRIIDRDLLGDYDPDRVFQTASGPKKATFTAMLTTFVSRSLLNYRDKQGVRRRREPVRLQEPAPGGNDRFPRTHGSLWIDLYAVENTEDVTEAVVLHSDFVSASQRALEHLASLPMRNPRDRRRFLPDLFRFCVEQVLLTGQVSRKEVARRFGCSDTAVYHMFRDLKTELRACGFEPGLI
jgi:DNA-directed RNA polymerase specialized sigma24 family protein